MIFRKWTENDNDQIADLEMVCFKTPWSREMLKLTFAQNNFYGVVCEIDGKIIGYVGCIYDNWDGQILNIAVSPDFRGKGVGEKLMTEIIEFLTANKKEHIFLEVRRSNSVAQALYEKLDFVPVGERKKYYENTEDAIVMAKVL